jgi:hypothetical protein
LNSGDDLSVIIFQHLDPGDVDHPKIMEIFVIDTFSDESDDIIQADLGITQELVEFLYGNLDPQLSGLRGVPFFPSLFHLGVIDQDLKVLMALSVYWLV